MADWYFLSNRQACENYISNLANRNLERACTHMVKAVKKTLTGQRTGRVYRVAGTKAYYTASAPGEPPAVRTGLLRNDIKYKISGYGLQLNGQVGTTLDYGLWLETGTRRMAPRPYLGPTFEKERLNIKRILEAGK